ncbi:MAG: hypothetical protein AAFU49_15345 [Pseudomonadota bacterium]
MSLTEKARLRGPRAARQRRDEQASKGTPILVIVFLFMLISPAAAIFYFGPLVMTPLRLFLLIITIPILLRFLLTVKLRIYDYLFIFSSIWYGFCHALNYGVGKGLQFGGLYFIFVIGTYALVQISIRKPEQIESVFRIVLFILIGLLPFAVMESFTGVRLISDVTGKIFGTSIGIQSDQRLGLYRAATSFAHPILYGLFCVATFSFIWYSTGPLVLRFLKTVVVTVAVFFSLSAGALVPLLLQILLIFCERVSRGIRYRAQYVIWGFLGLYTFLETFANSGAFGVMTRMLTLNAHTAYYRKAIWEYGIDDVMRHPIFGFVSENWTRPHWMTGSVDNHWLALLMRSGFVGTGALLLAIVIIFVKMMRRPDTDLPRVYANMRRASFYSLFAICVAGATVAFFDKMEPIFAFYIGIAALFARWEDQAATHGADAGRPSRRKALRQPGRLAPSNGPPEPAPDHPNASPDAPASPRKRRARPHLANGPQRRDGQFGSTNRRF